MITPLKILLLVGAAALLALIIFFMSLIPAGERSLGHLETIYGIPYPARANVIHVDEPLAHADLYLRQPAFGKQLELTVDYIPSNIESLAVGIRENGFWLSYPQQPMYDRETTTTSNLSPITSKVTIPLTDKLQEPDQSLDLMFFAEGENPEWELVSLTARVTHDWPTYREFKDYARATLYRERAL
jgi:hypothetical protein